MDQSWLHSLMQILEIFQMWTQGGHLIALMGDSLPKHGSQREQRQLLEAQLQVKR